MTNVYRAVVNPTVWCGYIHAPLPRLALSRLDLTSAAAINNKLLDRDV